MTIFLQAAGVAESAIATTTETLTEQPQIMSFGELFLAGGWLMWILLLLGAGAIYIFVERFIAIRKASHIDHNFMNRIRDFIYEGRMDAAVNLCKSTDTPIARMIDKGIERIGRPMTDVQNAIENVANLEVSKLENGLPALATISGGAVDMSLLSGGMYIAMITTVGGLIVGIPAYFGYNYLTARIEKLVFQMEANSIAFMDILNQPVDKKK